jgi:hypothetical protein
MGVPKPPMLLGKLSLLSKTPKRTSQSMKAQIKMPARASLGSCANMREWNVWMCGKNGTMELTFDSPSPLSHDPIRAARCAIGAGMPDFILFQNGVSCHFFFGGGVGLIPQPVYE